MSAPPDARASNVRNEPRAALSLRGSFDIFVALLSVGFAIFTVALLFARYYWPIDNATSFEPIYLVAGAILFVLTAVRRKRLSMGIALLAAMYHAGNVLPCYSILPHAKASGKPLRIMTANLQWDSPNPSLLYGVIKKEGPDILALEEVTPARLKDMEQLREEYP